MLLVSSTAQRMWGVTCDDCGMCSLLQACLLARQEMYVLSTKLANVSSRNNMICTAYTALNVQLEQYSLYRS